MTTTLMRFSLALLLAGLSAGCDPDGGNDPPAPVPFPATLQGTWISCVNEGSGASDQAEALTIDGDTVVSVQTTHASTDATCSGTGTVAGTFAGTFTIGGPVEARVGAAGGVVTARAIDVTDGGGVTFYSIVYVDVGPNPDVLYTGDQAIDPALDGSTPDRRPAVLEAWKPRYLGGLPEPSFADVIQGSWASCQGSYYGDVKERLSFSGESWSGLDTLHSSYDGSCSGSVVDTFSFGGSFTVGGAVPAQLGVNTVTAHATNLVASYPASVTLYTLLYVDAASTPDVLYIGDSSGARDGTTPANRPVSLVAQLPYRKQ